MVRHEHIRVHCAFVMRRKRAEKVQIRQTILRVRKARSAAALDQVLRDSHAPSEWKPIRLLGGSGGG